MATVAASAPWLEPMLRERAARHYRAAAGLVQGIDPAVLQARADHQVREALTFIPRYYGLAAGELLLLAGLALAARRFAAGPRALSIAILGLSLIELFGFGMDLNPAIDPDIQACEPPAIALLRARLKPGQRALGIGQELPPNVLMRFGLADPRNYDSVELASSLKWLEPLYEPGTAALSSRREITWEGVHRAEERLEECGVAAVVGPTPPPTEWFPRAERVGDVWIAWLAPENWVSAGPATTVTVNDHQPGRATVRADGPCADRLVIREAWDPGWKAWIDGRPVPLGRHQGTLLAIDVPAGTHKIVLLYHPDNVVLGIFCSAAAACAVILALTGLVRF